MFDEHHFVNLNLIFPKVSQGSDPVHFQEVYGTKDNAVKHSKRIGRWGRLSSSGPFLFLSTVFSFYRHSMCSCFEFVIVLCQPWLCNSCIKEKLTLIVQLIMHAQMETDRQMDTYTNIKGGSACTQLRFSVCVCADINDTYSMLCMRGRIVSEEMFYTNLVFLFFKL